jgi:hypothetical protein
MVAGRDERSDRRSSTSRVAHRGGFADRAHRRGSCARSGTRRTKSRPAPDRARCPRRNALARPSSANGRSRQQPRPGAAHSAGRCRHGGRAGARIHTVHMRGPASQRLLQRQIGGGPPAVGLNACWTPPNTTRSCLCVTRPMFDGAPTRRCSTEPPHADVRRSPHTPMFDGAPTHSLIMCAASAMQFRRKARTSNHKPFPRNYGGPLARPPSRL